MSLHGLTEREARPVPARLLVSVWLGPRWQCMRLRPTPHPLHPLLKPYVSPGDHAPTHPRINGPMARGWRGASRWPTALGGTRTRPAWYLPPPFHIGALEVDERDREDALWRGGAISTAALQGARREFLSRPRVSAPAPARGGGRTAQDTKDPGQERSTMPGGQPTWRKQHPYLGGPVPERIPSVPAWKGDRL